MTTRHEDDGYKQNYPKKSLHSACILIIYIYRKRDGDAHGPTDYVRSHMRHGPLPGRARRFRDERHRRACLASVTAMNLGR